MLQCDSYRNITIVNKMTERQRHTREIAHPMYETIDNG